MVTPRKSCCPASESTATAGGVRSVTLAQQSIGTGIARGCESTYATDATPRLLSADIDRCTSTIPARRPDGTPGRGHLKRFANALEAFLHLRRHLCNAGAIRQLQHGARIHELYAHLILVLTDNDVSWQKKPDLGLDLEHPVGELRVACAQKPIRRPVHAKLGSQRGGHIDLRQHAEPFLAELFGDARDCLIEGKSDCTSESDLGHQDLR